MDLETIRQDLADRYPQWARQIGNLRFEDATGVSPVDNDGRTIYYNSRLMRFYTSEVQCFYLAQQLLHLQLAHHARGAGKDRRVWKRASDAVVNRMLKQDGFQLPEDAPLPEKAFWHYMTSRTPPPSTCCISRPPSPNPPALASATILMT